MFKLIINYKNTLLQEVSLETKNEYTIGRDKSNNIVLPEKSGISRKHLVLTYTDNWVVQNISKQSNLQINGKTTVEGNINADDFFKVQDFEFILQSTKQEEELEQPLEKQSAEPQSTKKPAVNNMPATLSLSSSSENSQNLVPISSDGKTQCMDLSQNQSDLSAFLKISYSDNAPTDIFKLEDEEQKEWICGREDADININNPNISRIHFKIKKKDNQYYIVDLKSSNGTCLNDKELKPQKSYCIYSYDIIYILDIKITFEIKNQSLERSLSCLPNIVNNNLPEAIPVQTQSPYGDSHCLPTPFPSNLPSVVIESHDDPSVTPKFIKKNKKRLFIYAPIIVLIGMGYLFSGSKKESVNPQDSHLTGELSGFSKQEQQLIKDIYKNAQSLYSTGKFEYCKSELQKLHNHINSYEKSKSLNVACSQAAENKIRILHIEQQKQKAKKTEKFIQDVADKCDKKFKTFNFKHELILCLSPAIELSPADSRINILTERFEAIELEKQEKVANQAKRRHFINSIAVKYNYARKLNLNNKTLKAIAAYKVFIKLSNHRELKAKQTIARRELATIKQNFNTKNTNMAKKCEQPFYAKKFKQAYYNCKKASQQIPFPNNKQVISFLNLSKKELSYLMKPLYEEANLNESVGNVGTAKEYWSQIVNQDVDTGIYYKRAIEKLNKY